jgi:hypothetical protein
MAICGQIYHFVQENKSNIRQKLYEFVFNSKDWNRLRLNQKDPQLLETGVGDPSLFMNNNILGG